MTTFEPRSPSPASTCLLLVALLVGSPGRAADHPPQITWNRASDRVVSHTDNAAAYPRAKRLSNGDILLGYHHGGGFGEYGAAVALRRSSDGGRTWSDARDVEGPEEAFWGFSNVDFVELTPGRILLVTAGRGKALPGQPQFLSECEQSELRLRFSEDYGVTWGAPRGIAGGRGRVWEPSVVRFPGGELEIYYANEAPELMHGGRLDQRLEIVRSLDQGVTWSAPVEISQHPGARNGMPGAIVLKNGRVACAQEMVREPHSPWITQTLQGKPVEEYIAQRRYSFGAAPFLFRAPNDTTFLVFHSGHEKPPAPKDSPVPWMFANIFVQQGDAEAKNFGAATLPWPELNAQTGAFFPSMLMKDDRTVAVLASFITHREEGSRTVVRWIEGELVRDGK